MASSGAAVRLLTETAETVVLRLRLGLLNQGFPDGFDIACQRFKC